MGRDGRSNAIYSVSFNNKMCFLASQIHWSIIVIVSVSHLSHNHSKKCILEEEQTDDLRNPYSGHMRPHLPWDKCLSHPPSSVHPYVTHPMESRTSPCKRHCIILDCSLLGFIKCPVMTAWLINHCIIITWRKVSKIEHCVKQDWHEFGWTLFLSTFITYIPI